MNSGPGLPPARTLVLFTLLVALAGTFASHADQTRGVIPWRSGAVATPQQTSATIAQALSPVALDAGSHRLVQFNAPITPDQRAALAKGGVRLLRYVGDNAFFAAIDPTRNPAATIDKAGNVRCVLPIEPTWKLHSDLAAGVVHNWAVVEAPKSPDASDAIVAVYVVFHADIALGDTGTQILLQHGGHVRSLLESINGAVVELPAAAIDALAAEDAVQWIEPPLPRFSELNNDNRNRTGAEIVQATPYGLSGAGVSVLVYDGGYGLSDHPDFGGRHTVRDDSGLSDHATHVAGTIGGDGTDSSGTYRGMAPAVTIESYGFEQEGGLQEGFLYTDPGDIEDDYSEAISVYGVDISNNSIGTNTAPNGYPCEWEGNYGATGVLIDTIVRGDGTNPLFATPFRVVWANGNERQTSRCLGIEGYPGEFHSTAPPACAKNHITVGALNSNDDSVTSFTSFGPTDDGRLKPDVSAPGCQSNDDATVTSCSAYGGYTGKCGTSMAAPTVCGLAALLLEDFRAHYPGEPDPRNATLKTFFAHTAVDIENAGPDYKTGYGSVRIEPAIDLLRGGHFFEAATDHGDAYSAVAIVQPGDTALKITLAWDDVPGTPNVNPVLVNDLDLRVYGPDGTQYFPWTLNPLEPNAPAVRTAPDHVNNIEQVYIESPDVGAYQIEVYGHNVPLGPQTFSLAATPFLVNCSSQGTARLNANKFPCGATATLKVVDCDLNTSDTIVDTVTVDVASTSESTGETVILTETAAASAAFEGTIELSETDDTGVLLVAPGDVVTLTYNDADDGTGSPAVVTDVADVDCTPPAFIDVQVTQVNPFDATLTIELDEPARLTVRYGEDCTALIASKDGFLLEAQQSIVLRELLDETTYYFAVDAVDEAGNASTADNGGVCYAFTTPEVPDHFTEEFDHEDNDLDYTTILFTPAGGLDHYLGCAQPLAALPTDPNGGNLLDLSDDDYAEITLSGGATVELYGVTYDTMYVSSNGNLTFTDYDTDYSESLSDHFSLPRVAPLFDDFNPNDGGTISWKQLADRCVVTWFAVPEYGTDGLDLSTFQAELYFDGRITLNYLNVDAVDGLAGLSNGSTPEYFRESNLSDLGQCLFDCNSNGIPDYQDIADGTSLDCNGNHIPDECDVAEGYVPDCNTNGVPDECDITDGTSPDCNTNGVPDECDIATGTSPDCNANGVPDECDVATGTSLDCNANGVPDECDLAGGTSGDCNTNGVPDECDIATGTSLDCNANGVPDTCDLASGASDDCNTNGLPDECDTALKPPVVTDAVAARLGWYELFGIGTPLNLGNEGYAIVTMPFTNAVFNDSAVTIHNNGGIGFGGGTLLPASNAPIPYAYAFDGAAAAFPFWDDLDSDTGDVYWHVIGTTPDRTFIVEWYKRPHSPGDTLLDGDEVTFQAHVFERPIAGVYAQFLYQDTDFKNWRYDDGVSASVGFQTSDTDGYLWSFNEAIITPDVVLSVQGQPSDSPDVNGNQVPDECEPWLNCKGDANCDQVVSWRDIDYFVAGMGDAEWQWRQLFADPSLPGCPFSNLDCSGDGTVNWRDIDPLVGYMGLTCPHE